MSESTVPPEIYKADIGLAANEKWVKGDPKEGSGEAERAKARWERVKSRFEATGIKTYPQLTSDLHEVVYGWRTKSKEEQVEEAKKRLEAAGFQTGTLKEMRREYFEKREAKEKEAQSSIKKDAKPLEQKEVPEQVQPGRGVVPVEMSEMDAFMNSLDEDEQIQLRRIRTSVDNDNQMPSDVEAMKKLEEWKAEQAKRKAEQPESVIIEEDPEQKAARAAKEARGKKETREGEDIIDGEIVGETPRAAGPKTEAKPGAEAGDGKERAGKTPEAENPWGFDNRALIDAASLGDRDLFRQTLAGLMGKDLSREDLDRARAFLESEEPNDRKTDKNEKNPFVQITAETIPNDPIEVGKLYRRLTIQTISEEGVSTSIEPEIIRGRIQKRLKDVNGAPVVDMFSDALGVNEIAEIKEEFEAELSARINLRLAELQELGYKSMKDKQAARERYIGDRKGSASSASSAVDIDRETKIWLRKGCIDYGDGLTTNAIDRAFSILVLLGEKSPDFSAEWAQPFEQFRDGSLVDKKTNYWDPSYPADIQKQVDDLINSSFGKDAATLARQLFMALKEEGNYNWQHYLSADFDFANSRHSLATLVKPPAYAGSSRIYTFPGAKTADHSSYRDEMKVVALSPLRSLTKVGQKADLDRIGEQTDDLRRDVLLQRAMDGRFLADTPFEDKTMIKESKQPEEVAFATIKDGEKMRAAISSIGELGSGEKTTKVGEATKAFTEIGNVGESMIVGEVITKDELRRQITFEIQNAFWEISLDNPKNRTDNSYALPSIINRIAGAINAIRLTSGELLIDDNQLKMIHQIVKDLNTRTWELVKDRLDEETSKKEKVQVDAILPSEVGFSDIVPRLEMTMRPVRSVLTPLDKIVRAGAGLLGKKL